MAGFEVSTEDGKDDALRERVTTGRMAAATFRHESSRALDPQIHTHVVIGNLTRRDDGEWRALEPVEMFRAQKLATATYRTEMARSVEALGYGIEVRKDGSVGIAGFTREDLEAFSQRLARRAVSADCSLRERGTGRFHGAGGWRAPGRDSSARSWV